MLMLKLILLFIILLVLAFFRTSPKIWTAILTLVLLSLTLLSIFPPVFLWVFWLVFIPVAIFFNFASVRSATLMPWILKYFRSVLPPISKSEKEVLDAGEVWWEGDLFCGKPDWHYLQAMPKAQLTKKEQIFLDDQVETLCEMINDWQIVNEERNISEKVWDYIKKERFLGLVIPTEYGGHGFSHLAHSEIITKISSRSASVGITVMVPNALGTGEFIQHYGTEEQKAYYLPKLALGEEIPAFALTAPEAGSDAGNIPDIGIVCEDEFEGKKVIGIRLNWNKRYITLAPIATVLGLAIKLYDPDQLIGECQNIGITLCLVPTDLPGVEAGKRHFPAGLPFLNGPTRGKNVFIPLDFVIGGPDKCGKGWQMMMEGLAAGRGISLPAFSAGSIKVAFRTTGAYCALREQFRLPIGEFEGIKERLAEIGGLTYLSEATRYFTLVGLSQGVKPALAAAITKYHLTEMNRKIINDAMDIHGGRAVQWGPNNYLSILYQSIPIGITVEGANILTRNLIIFGQGAMRCHPYIKHEVAAASDQDAAHGALRFDRLFCQHLGYSLSQFARTFIYGLTGGHLICTIKNNPLAKYLRQLTRMSVALAFVSDVIIAKLGGELKRREQFSARMGDVLSQLYLGSSVVKYFHDQGSPKEDLPFATWALEKCLYEIQNAFETLFDNLIPSWSGRLIYSIVFPWGKAYRYPKDNLGHEIAMAMLKTSSQRDRITKNCYIGKNDEDALKRLENTLNAFQNLQPLRARLQEVVQILNIPRHTPLADQIEQVALTDKFTEDELKILRHFAKLYSSIISVDEFDPSFFIRKESHDRKQTKVSDL